MRGNLNVEVNCTEPFPPASVPWIDFSCLSLWMSMKVSSSCLKESQQRTYNRPGNQNYKTFTAVINSVPQKASALVIET